MYTHDGIFVSGEWRPSVGDPIPIINPATEEIVAHAASGTAEDVDAAVRAATAAMADDSWRGCSLERRMELVRAIGEGLLRRADEIALTQTMEMGAPLTGSRRAVAASLNLLQSYLDAVEEVDFEALRRDPWGQALIRRDPVGVVAAIIPWNGPLPVVINKVIPALLAGCAAVIKPSPEAPFEAGIFAEVCAAAGLPDGVVNVVPGARETGELVVRHDGIAKVSFTGSTAAGRRVGAICGESFRRCSLELGGKSAAILLDDAVIEQAIPVIAAGNFGNTGQACIALSRVLVSRTRYDEVVEALVAAANRQMVGDPLNELTTIGPLVAQRQRDRVESYVATGADEGAKVATGGGRPAGLDRGWFFEPTVFVNVDNTMRIAREEIFGPVASVIAYDDPSDAIAIANDSPYGLHGAIFTDDLERGLELANQVESGTVTINSYGTNPSAPFGGIKCSGIGREHGPEGIGEFLEHKTVVIPEALADRLARRAAVGGDE